MLTKGRVRRLSTSSRLARARDKQGNFYVTLNVGFGGGHQSKAPWRGWCVQITPKGEMIPYALRPACLPNGINFSPDGDLFYTDNQGEWVATNKLHHIKKGEYYGHPAGLRWVKQSPFADLLKESYPSGMQYDGQQGPTGVKRHAGIDAAVRLVLLLAAWDSRSANRSGTQRVANLDHSPGRCWSAIRTSRS